jgi:hypothetical protein
MANLGTGRLNGALSVLGLIRLGAHQIMAITFTEKKEQETTRTDAFAIDLSEF